MVEKIQRGTFSVQSITARFVRYAKINTRSDPNSTATPTTPGQTELARTLVTDLQQLGFADVTLLANGYVTATVPATKADARTIGFIAHLDTAAFASERVAPQVHPNYDGQAVSLGALTLDPDVFPQLKKLRGQTLITGDGTTLLGADDKAGIVGAIAAGQYLLAHPEIPHGPVRFGFGPDEEIGKGAHQFDVAQFGAEFAYTLDNGAPGDLMFETFNAAQAVIEITGKSVHPGEAKDQLINALKVAQRIDGALPAKEVPEKTAGYEGFFLLDELTGDVGHARMQYIVRDFDATKFAARKQLLQQIVADLNAAHAAVAITTTWTEKYRNMGEVLAKVPRSLDLAKVAYAKQGLPVHIVPFRGGTDGSIITAKGMPTPNLFNGGANFHGPYEYVTAENIAQLAGVIVQIVALGAEMG